MKQQPTVIVGICAYNSACLIEKLLQSLTTQKIQGFNLKQIIVHCDLSGDQTAQVVKNWNKKHQLQNLIKATQPAKKLGFAGSFKATLALANSDIVVMLNDDILIRNSNFLSQVIQDFNQPNVGLGAVNLKQLPPRSFVEKAINSSIRAYEQTRITKDQGNNLYTCDGKVLVLSRKFINQLTFPKNLSLVGNLDAYLYLSCLYKGFKYIFISKASVYHHNPATIREYISWTSRNNSNYFLLQKTFGELVEKEYHLPKKILWQNKLKQLIKYPVECLFLFGTSFYIKLLARKQALNFNPKWDSVLSTKVIN